MRIYLLTHQRELNRTTNTGQLALRHLPEQVERIIWDRVNPNQQLIKLINNRQIVLLHPHGQEIDSLAKINSSSPTDSSLAVPTTKASAFLTDNFYSTAKPDRLNNDQHFLILDATWQEARKMFNRSDYLKQVDKLSLSTEKKSAYILRRNQPVGGLCTVECIIQLLIFQGEINKAEILQSEFIRFNQHLQK
jgi:DTW domain-containing protein YfiP